MSYSSEVLADSPSAYWRLGETYPTLTDSSGNNRNGNYRGGASAAATGLVAGDSNGAHTFGGGARGVVADAAWQDATSFTVLATITPSSVSGVQTIVSRYDSYSQSTFSPSSFSLRMNGTSLECHIFVGNTPGAATATATLAAGTTYDVAATYDGTTVKVYVNGGNMGSASRAGMNNASMPLTIGATSVGGEAFGGVIDDVSYFGSVLTATQIANFSTQRASGSGYASSILAATPLAYYRLGEPSVTAAATSTTMADSSGSGRDGSYSGDPTAGATGALTGDSNTAVTFTTSQYATTTYAAWQDFTTALTVEAWVKHSGSGYREVITKDASGAGGSGSQWRIRVSDTNHIEFLLWHSAVTNVSSTTVLTAGTWYHVVGTYDAATGVQAVYINGALDASATGLTGNITTGTTPIIVGRVQNGIEPYSGTLDELAVYPTALSSTRIAAHYSAATTASTAASGTASLSLSATGSTSAASAGTASLSLSASGGTSAAAAGTASLNLSAVGDTVAPSPASGTASLTLSASGAAVGAAAGTASLNLAATGAALATLAASGTAALTLSASGSAVMSSGGTASLTLLANGVAIAVYTTDLSNAFDGLDVVCVATVTLTYAPAPLPPSLVPAAKYDKAVPYPVPVMVGGRPT